jgi:threonylcarbamoyladenosine tRNA methylthiotransferase MtaB
LVSLGESEVEFNETYNYLKRIKFVKMHVFPYSKRDGTVAAAMQNQIDEKIKKERARILIELSNKNEEEYYAKKMGKVEEVLIETTKSDIIAGHTKDYVKINIEGDKKSLEKLEGEIVAVDVFKQIGLELYGKRKE